MRRQFYTCPKCGSHLDFGERCDCEEERAREEEKKRIYFEKKLVVEKSGQLALVI